ncbi:MAG: hypothetical protein NTY36_14930 [Deltaproteobacteria bacterium]|nr:hypothetical protein [Deltaproteobacteria bacterium]
MFNDEFLDNLPEDYGEAGKAICDKFFEFYSRIPTSEDIDHHYEYVEAYAFLEAFLDAYGVTFDKINLTNNLNENIT